LQGIVEAVGTIIRYNYKQIPLPIENLDVWMFFPITNN